MTFYTAVRNNDCLPRRFVLREEALVYIAMPLFADYYHVAPDEINELTDKFKNCPDEDGFYVLDVPDHLGGPMYGGWVEQWEFEDDENLKYKI